MAKRTQTNGNRRSKVVAITTAALLSACAADYTGRALPDGDTLNPLELERRLAAEATCAKVSFHFADFHSLMSPNSSTGCAGDARTYHQPFVADPVTGTSPFPTSFLDPKVTIKPDFIKNIAVDLTDANSSLPSNRASGCSYGTGAGLPPPSSCATFDYGAAGGVASSLGGSLLLVGGTLDDGLALPPWSRSLTASCGATDLLAAVPNACAQNATALALETLPATAATDPPNELAPGLDTADAPISSWVNLAGSISYNGPEGLAGAGAAHDAFGKKFLLFGGSSSVMKSGYRLGQMSSGSWVMDLTTQSWTHIPALSNTNVDSSLLRLLDGANQVQKPAGARMLFGYVSAQGMGFTGMTAGPGITAVDPTDRLVIIGGMSGAGPHTDMRRFNPTYGPDWVDTLDGNPGVKQWLDSYHTQLMSNSMASSQLRPDFPPNAPASPNTPVNFAATSLRNNTGGMQGHLLTAGGFDSASTVNTPDASCVDLEQCGVLSRADKSAPNKSGFLSLPNALLGSNATPPTWTEITETGDTVPWYGGATLLPGFNLSQNEVVYFGGASCKSYMTSVASCTFDNQGRYWRFTTDPGTIANTTGIGVPLTGDPSPKYAGMAAARGLDAAGNVIIVAWGGAQAARTAAPAKEIHILYDNAGTPTWVKIDPLGSIPTTPTGLINSSLVFSHVTGKFYLFGGYNPTSNFISGDTWQLEILNTAAGCAADPASCFRWTQLNADSRFSCYPSCPTARHSHRMAEANYFNRNPGGSVSTPDGESACTAQEPCSFGIFMEGGSFTATGTELASDRWMFDPTANGIGQWIRMGELPPRTLPAMTALEYKLPDQNTRVRRALLFGGETGLQSLASVAPGKYFVAPTLGDTLMFDFETHQWNRVELLGKGYSGGLPADPPRAAREAYNADNPTQNSTNDLSVLSPPPLSGAVMVTRTHEIQADGTQSLLPVPEAYLFGGRKKDGGPLSLDHVYKFCPGTTGELPFGALNDARCNFFDPDANPDLVVPTSKYEGRWLLKTPDVFSGTPSSSRTSFMGAGTYDSYRDRIVLFGGIWFTGMTNAVTQATDKTGSTSVLEYKPALRVSGTSEEIDGQWLEVPACSESPAIPEPRYGHSLSYDTMKRRLVVVGGYSIGSATLSDGTPLLQEVRDWTGTYFTPEVWVGTRIDAPLGNNERPGFPAIGTAPCYYWSKISVFGNTRYGDPSQAPPQLGIAHAASLFLPSSGYNTGYYTLLDNACAYQGPIASPEPEINKLLAGGAYIDIDRSKLGPSENLILHLTYIPFGTENLRPDSMRFSQAETAVFKVHLVKTGQTKESLMHVFQPRYFTYTASEQYPQVAHTIAVLAPPTGQVRQDQVLIPLMLDQGVDRIRIERHSGSGILIDVGLFRMGYR